MVESEIKFYRNDAIPTSILSYLFLKQPPTDGTVLSLFYGSKIVVDTNLVGQLPYNLVKKHFVIYFYILKTIINTRAAVDN